MQHTGHLRQSEQDQLKSKIRRTCENYYRIKIPYQYEEIIKKPSNKKDIIILRQDKGRGLVVLNCTSYIEKCSNILTSDQFKVFENDPTKTLESKIQRVLRKIKHAVDEKLYNRLYPTSSKPGSFYGTAKVHKLKEREGVDKLTLRPIISNIGTATYEIARYLAELLAPLGKSKYTISNTKDFITRLKTERIPKRFKMISFDVKSLFTNVPLEETIDIILNKIYDEKKIETNIPRNIMKDLLYL